jgi:catechol 2,3-dioxygenase-like lactoylglutathione lyase family enzyme
MVRSPVLHVTDVDASIRFYVDRLGFSSPWRFDGDGKTFVAKWSGRAARSSFPADVTGINVSSGSERESL